MVGTQHILGSRRSFPFVVEYVFLVLCQVDHLRCWWCGSKVGIIVCDLISIIVIILKVFNE
jgi:hypothetical protein